MWPRWSAILRRITSKTGGLISRAAIHLLLDQSARCVVSLEPSRNPLERTIEGMSKPLTGKPRILVADDQEDILNVVRMLLNDENMEAHLVQSPEEALKVVREKELDVVLLDLNYARDITSGREGIDLIRSIREQDAGLPLIVMTAWATVDLAVEAMRVGARDFIQKPLDARRLISILRTQTDLRRMERQNRNLREENRLLRERHEAEFVAESAPMRNIDSIIQRVATSDASVLITGDNGTGKGMVARRLHALSDRADRPFISVNIGGLSEGVFESELFGHVRGAFTDAKEDRVGRYELADGGTLFLDEIGNLPLSQQAKLLRLLETGEYERVGSSRTQVADVRVVSATNADLSEAVEARQFREDLLYRLNTVPVHVPPLRDRLDDLAPLARLFLEKHLARYPRARARRLSEETLGVLRSHAWPGNVRELDHTIERAILLCRGDVVEPADLGMNESRPAAPSLDGWSLEEMEQHMIRRSLERHGGNVSQAARELGLARGTLYTRMSKLGL